MRIKNKIIALVITNNERNISKTIKSIKSQTRKADYIFISNEKYKFYNDNEIKNIKNKYKFGLARNTMFALVEIWKKYGENIFIATLDDDDLWEKDYLKYVEKKILKGYNFISSFLKVYENKNYIETYEFKKENINIKEFILGNPGIQGSNKVFKLKIALESGGMLKHSNASTDRAFAINLLSHPETKFGLIKKGLVIFNKDNNRKRISNNKKRISDLIKFYESFANFIDEKDIVKINERHKTLHGFPKVIKWKK